MDQNSGWNRRRFLGSAMAMAASQFGIAGTADANARESRQLAALGRATEWLKEKPSLLGKVVLVQFGTYTCINWLRTLPYVRAWDERYRQHGLAVIGVNTPEFVFEQNVQNVRRAVEQMKIEYPITIDNDYAIWRAFDNHYWPALYFIDARGRLRQHHFGEGEYARSEKAIQRLLTDASAANVGTGVVSVTGSGAEAAADWENLRSPEIYLGHDRAENFSSPGGVERGRRRLYVTPARLTLNRWALSGEWTIAPQPAILSRAPGKIACRFHARDVHLVMGTTRQETAARFRVSIDGTAPGPAHGQDTDEGGSGTVRDQRLYQLIRQPGPIVDRTFEIEFLDSAVEAYAFTFG